MFRGQKVEVHTEIVISQCAAGRPIIKANKLGSRCGQTSMIPASKRQLQQQVSGRVNVIRKNHILDVDCPILIADEGKSSEVHGFVEQRDGWLSNRDT